MIDKYSLQWHHVKLIPLTHIRGKNTAFRQRYRNAVYTKLREDFKIGHMLPYSSECLAIGFILVGTHVKLLVLAQIYRQDRLIVS